MKYRPSLPEHNDNVSPQYPLKDFILILLGLSGIALIAFWILGLLVNITVDHASERTVAAFNNSTVFQWKNEKPFAPQQEAMLQVLADELRQCANWQYAVKIHLAEEKEANAAALLGGQIVIFSGLLDKVRSRNGMAFVIAHELAHLKNRDHLRAMGRSVVLVAISTALTSSNSAITQLLTPITQVGNASYSREREAIADNTALQTLNCRYGHVGGASEFFEALMKDEEKERAVLTHFFASHPELQTRIDELNSTIKKLRLKTGAVEPMQSGVNRS